MTPALPPTSPFAGDDGSADAALSQALGVHHPPGRLTAVVEALAGARVLVPVMAELGVAAAGAGGLTVDKEATTGVVALRAPDGRAALPVFSSTDELARWAADARPVPAEGPRAAAAALQEGWELLVLDPAGAAVVVPRPAVVALAEGRTWRPAVVAGAVRQEVVDLVRGAVGQVGRVVEVRALPGRRAEVAVELGLEPGLDRVALDGLLAEVGSRLGSAEGVVAAVDSLELRVVGAPR